MKSQGKAFKAERAMGAKTRCWKELGHSRSRMEVRMSGAHCAGGRSHKIRKHELDCVGPRRPQKSLDFFPPGISGKPLKGFKQGRGVILKKTEVAKWRADCKM